MENKKISFLSAVVMTINLMIGGGLLAGSSRMAGVGGSLSFIGWIIVTALYFPVVLSIIRMTEVFTQGSGFIYFTRAGLGRFMGFFGGWTYFLGYAAAAGMLIFSCQQFLLTKFPGVNLIASNAAFLMISLLVIAGLNSLKASIVASVQTYLTLIKLIPVVSAVALLPWVLDLSKFSFTTEAFSLVPNTVPMAAFGFLGFEFCVNNINNIEGGINNAKKAIMTGFIIVASLFVLFHFSVTNIMGAENLFTHLAGNYPAFLPAGLVKIGEILTLIVPFCFFVTFFNSSNGLFFLDAVSLNLLGEESVIKGSSELVKKNEAGRPIISVLLAGITIFLMSYFMGSIDQLASACCMGALFGLLCSVASLLICDTNASLIQTLTTVAAAIVLSGLITFCFVNSGATLTEMIKNNAVFFGLIALGPILYKS